MFSVFTNFFELILIKTLALNYFTSRYPILNACFSGEDAPDIPEVIEWPIKENEKIHTSKEEVFEQVLAGLKFFNKANGTNYKLSKIYFFFSKS